MACVNQTHPSEQRTGITKTNRPNKTPLIMNKPLIVSIIAIIMSAVGSNAQTRFRIDAETASLAADDINDIAGGITRTLEKKWRKANRQLTEDQQDDILEKAKIIVANRYMPLPNDEDTTIIDLVVASKPVGLVMLNSGDAAIAMAYVNEAGDVEYVLNPSEAETKVAKLMDENDTYVIAGIDQPWKLFFGQSGSESTIDLTTGTTAIYDYSTMPEIAYTETTPRRPGAVIGSICGGCAAVALIALAAVL